VLQSLALASACLIFACSRGENTGLSAQPSARPVATNSAPPASAQAVQSAPAPAESAAPARNVYTGEGITITETTAGQVILKTTDLWGAAINTTYADCTYYTNAIPVLKRSLTPQRGELLAKACAQAQKSSKSAPSAAAGATRAPRASASQKPSGN
jgi:hypothetical protein